MSSGTVMCALRKPLDVWEHGYLEPVGSIMYLMVGTKTDLAFSVGALVRHISKPTVAHWEAAKDVLRYVAGTAMKC